MENKHSDSNISEGRKGYIPVLPKFSKIRRKAKRIKANLSLSAATGSPVPEEVPKFSPAFTAQPPKVLQKMKRNAPIKDIMVPYSRLRKERFYNWPPAALNVSRATPAMNPNGLMETLNASESPNSDKNDQVDHTTRKIFKREY